MSGVVPSRDIKNSLEKLTKKYEQSILSSPAEKYLRERGITKEAQDYFRLGLVVDPEPEERIFNKRLSIPYIVGDSVVGIKYRSITDYGEKYISSVGFYAQRIFNPNVLAQLHLKVYVTEGELDTITLWQLGIPAIAIPGVNNWNPVNPRILRNRKIVVLADGDDKEGQGMKLGKKILTSVDGSAIVKMEGTDVNQFYTDQGAAALMEYIGWKESASG